MNTDRDLQDRTARRARGRPLAYIAAGAAIAALLMALGPAPDPVAPRAGLRLLEQAAPAVPQHVASLGADVHWEAMEAAADPAPLAVAAYEH